MVHEYAMESHFPGFPDVRSIRPGLPTVNGGMHSTYRGSHSLRRGICLGQHLHWPEHYIERKPLPVRHRQQCTNHSSQHSGLYFDLGHYCNDYHESGD